MKLQRRRRLRQLGFKKLLYMWLNMLRKEGPCRFEAIEDEEKT